MLRPPGRLHSLAVPSNAHDGLDQQGDITPGSWYLRTDKVRERLLRRLLTQGEFREPIYGGPSRAAACSQWRDAATIRYRDPLIGCVFASISCQDPYLSVRFRIQRSEVHM